MANCNYKSVEEILRSPSTEEVNESVEDLNEDLSDYDFYKKNRKSKK